VGKLEHVDVLAVQVLQQQGGTNTLSTELRGRARELPMQSQLVVRTRAGQECTMRWTEFTGAGRQAGTLVPCPELAGPSQVAARGAPRISGVVCRCQCHTVQCGWSSRWRGRTGPCS
jgi:hypothetical protein